MKRSVPTDDLLWNYAFGRITKPSGEHTRAKRHPRLRAGWNHPIVSVNWDDATAFNEWLTRRKCRGQLAEGQQYRLPTTPNEPGRRSADEGARARRIATGRSGVCVGKQCRRRLEREISPMLGAPGRMPRIPGYRDGSSDLAGGSSRPTSSGV